MTSNTVSLVELVDLSLGTPEVVNYNALRRLLVVIVENLNLGDLQTELSQSDLQDGSGISQSKTVLQSQEELEKKLSKLETQIESLNALPSNENLLERTRSSSTESVKPVSEMWQLMQLQKKVVANEEGISKLMSMMEHMMSEVNDLKGQTSSWKSELDSYKQLINAVEEKCKNADERIRKLEESTSSIDKIQELQSLMNDFNNKLNVWPDPATVVTWPAMEDALKGIQTEPVAVYDNTSQTTPIHESTRIQTMPMHDAHVQTKTPEPHTIPPSPVPSSRPGTASSGHSAHPSLEIQQILRDLGELRGDHDKLDNRVKTLEETMPTKVDLSEIKELLSGQRDIPEDLASQLESLSERLDALSKSQVKDSESLTEMQGVLLQLQAEVEKLNSTLVHLVDEHNAKQKHIDALYTYIDRLQEFKADKEHVIMEIDVKADKRALDNKISRAQFEGTVDELSKNLQEVMHKLSGHTNAWEDAVSEMKLDIDNKLDRMELDPLKSYLDKRIKVASAKMIPKETEGIGENAAGFRKPLMQKFHCISCDKPLDIATHGPIASLPESKPLPGNRSGRPYTTFELEQIRAAQKKNLPPLSTSGDYPSFQMEPNVSGLQGELMKMKHTKQMTEFLKVKAQESSSNYQDVPAYFSASRSCGGSHTLTYPHRRTNRVPYLNQAFQDLEGEPIRAIKVEHDIQGQDGHIYKGRQDTDRLPNLAVPKNTKPSRPGSARQASRPHSAKNGNKRPMSGRTSKSPRPPGSPEGFRVEAQLPSASLENSPEQANQHKIPAEKPLEQVQA
ncbi:glutamine-rich protein 2-like isoform X2 [Anneissia japonica]|uniref:glutamine-rich protein 2-like isoform X2 n=1 Tax=Anneissia japonica TaxID=1529436 RepID=UPI0014255852|nr:glutamine-rich protein 2-like isoform X2 [Anneissia japonica]